MSPFIANKRPARGRVVAALIMAAVLGAAAASTSTPAGAVEGDEETAGVRVTVTVPPGSLSVTARVTREVDAFPLRATTVRVVVTDTRAGAAGFTLSAGVRDGLPAIALLTGVSVEQVPGNGLDPDDVRTVTGGLVTPRAGLAVASYPDSLGMGSVVVTATVLTPMLGSAGVDLVWTLL